MLSLKNQFQGDDQMQYVEEIDMPLTEDYLMENATTAAIYETSELSAHFAMLGHHRRQSMDEIDAAGKRAAENKAQSQDIQLIQSLIGPSARYHGVVYIRTENLDIKQGIARPGGPRHWQCRADAVYKVQYIK